MIKSFKLAFFFFKSFKQKRFWITALWLENGILKNFYFIDKKIKIF